MIIIKTKMQRIPSKCTDCKFSYTIHGIKYCPLVSDKKQHREVKLEFVPTLKNYAYIRPYWCPLQEV